MRNYRIGILIILFAIVLGNCKDKNEKEETTGKAGKGSCLFTMNWTAFSAKGKENPNWFEEFCMNTDEKECTSNMGFSYNSESCDSRGFSFKCTYQSDSYLIKTSSGCPN